MVRIFANKSETCVLFAAKENTEEETVSCKLMVLFPEAPSPIALYEMFPDGTDRYLGLFVIQGQADATKHRMFRNVVLQRYVPDQVS